MIEYEASEVLTNVYFIFQMHESHDKLFVHLCSVCFIMRTSLI